MAVGKAGSSVCTKNWRPDACCHVKRTLSHGWVKSSNRRISDIPGSELVAPKRPVGTAAPQAQS